MNDKSQFRTASRIVQLANAIVWLRNTQLQDLQLTSSQSETLLYILRQPPDREIFAGNLMDDLRLSQSTVAGIVKRLEDKGLIRRTTASHDNRKSIISLTDRGRQLDQVLRRNAVRTEAALLDGMSAAERQQLLRLLEQAEKNLALICQKGGHLSHE